MLDSNKIKLMMEKTIMPGVYITDYRKNKPQNNSDELSVYTAEEYERELREKGLINPEYLRSERSRYERAITKLEETNSEIRDCGDEELLSIIEENSVVIIRFQGYLKTLNDMLGENNSIYL